MNNLEFLEVIKDSFQKYLITGSRSNKKLKILHGSIAKDLKERLGNEYTIYSLGYRDNIEISMPGRYMDKKVDIAIEKEKKIIGAIALKYIMRNYSQNTNNYFENMLGETANIRCNGKPYFQIIILPSQVPYFKNGGKLDHIESITKHNLAKYIKLSNDNISEFLHTPNKTLIYLINMPDIPTNIIKNQDDYIEYYQKNNNFKIEKSLNNYKFGNAVIFNDYEKFIEKVCHYIQSI